MQGILKSFPLEEYESDGAFSIDIGLELVEVAGPICRVGLPYNL